MEEAAMKVGAANRPHILAIPYPLMGHMTPIVQLCNILIARAGCRATIVCSETAVPSLRKLLPQQHEELHHLKVLPISDGLPLDMGPVTWDSIREALRHGYHDGLPRSFAQHICSFSDVVCVISDMYLSWTQDVADELGVPRLAFWVAAAAEYQVYFHAKDLIKKGTLPFKEPLGKRREVENMIPGVPGRLPIYHRMDDICADDEKINIPGLPSLHRRDFPTFLQIEDSSDDLFCTFIDHIKTGLQASMVLFNTFESLDNTLLDVIRSQGIRAHPIGPLFLLEEQATNKQVHTKQMELQNGRKMAENFQDCLGWLDKQKPHSVIYVAFGTLIQLTKPQAEEIALGLLNSTQQFIWVYQSSAEEGGRRELPHNFLEQVEGKGLVLEWAPQKLILKHPSTGAFLSHCGWNSTLEFICFGVPILCLPYATDQLLHCKMIVDEWNVGLRLERSPKEGIALAKDVLRLTQELLIGRKGHELKKRAQELKHVAGISIQARGSSCITLDAIIKLVKIPSKE